jgi:hypothetical protein
MTSKCLACITARSRDGSVLPAMKSAAQTGTPSAAAAGTPVPSMPARRASVMAGARIRRMCAHRPHGRTPLARNDYVWDR